MKHKTLITGLLPWFSKNARPLPWRQTHDPYAIWVSEIMLQQTQVKTVLRYWERWMEALPDIASLAQANPEKLHKLWEGLGYYTRVRNMQQAAKIIVSEHDGHFPVDFDSVLALPGIGRYTAGAICSIAFNQPCPILDGNVIRVLTRLFGIEKSPRDPKTNATLWRIAGEIVVQAAADLKGEPARNAQHARRNANSPGRVASPEVCSHLNQSLMELGALVCTPREPQCGTCPVSRHCVARRQGRQQELPKLGPRARSSERHLAAFVVQANGRFLVRQRPEGVVNAHLWEFPNCEVVATRKPVNEHICRLGQQLMGMKAITVEKLCTIKHSITRYRITLDVFDVSANGSFSSIPPGFIWLSRNEVRQRPFTAAHKRLWAMLVSPRKKA